MNTTFRRLIATITLALVLFSQWPALARAATANNPAVQVRCEANPSTLSAQGTVMLVFTVTNNAPADIYGLQFYYDGMVIATQNYVASGATATVQVPSFYVKQSALGVPIGIPYNFSYLNNPQSGQCTALIQLNTQGPIIDFTRTIEPRVVTPGGVTQLVYTVENKGITAINNVRIFDELLTEEVANFAALLPGEKRSFPVSFRPTQDALSRPELWYDVAGTSGGTKNVLEPMDIRISVSELLLQLSTSAGETMPGDEVALTLTLINNGTQNYTNLQVYEDTMGLVDTIPRLEVGRDYVIRRIVRPMSDTGYQFTVNATDMQGKPDVFPSTTVHIRVLSPVPQAVRLKIGVEPSATQLTAAGKVSFLLTLSNEGAEPLANVVIEEATLGTVQTIETLLPGDKTVRVETNIEKTSDFYFSATADMPNGQDGMVKAEVVTIALRAEAAASSTPRAARTPRPSVSSAETPAPVPTPALQSGANAALTTPEASAASVLFTNSASAQSAPPASTEAGKAEVSTNTDLQNAATEKPRINKLYFVLWLLGLIMLCGSIVYLVHVLRRRGSRYGG